MIIITGASSGIGKHIFERFAEEDKEEVIGIYHQTEPTIGHDKFRHVDLTNADEVQRFVTKMGHRLQNIKVIHCAGATENAMAHKIEPETWSKIIDANLKSAFLVSRFLLPTMREQNFGRIIYFSSVVQKLGVPGTVAYAAAKSGLLGLMETIVKENAAKNITCNTLVLGYFNIGMINKIPGAIQNEIMKSIPSQKFGNPIDIMNAIEFILKSEYLNGAKIEIDGGL